MSQKVRMMEPKDLPAIWRMADAQNRRDGTSYPFPRVFEMDSAKPRFGQLVENVPLALVVENGNRVRQGFICMRTIEVFGVGGGDMEFSAAHIPMMADFLRRKGYDDLHTFVPRNRATAQHCKLLEDFGMTRLDPRLATFYRTT